MPSTRRGTARLPISGNSIAASTAAAGLLSCNEFGNAPVYEAGSVSELYRLSFLVPFPVPPEGARPSGASSLGLTKSMHSKNECTSWRVSFMR